MALRLSFVLLGIKVNLGDKKNASTGYVELTFGGRFGHPYLEQKMACKVSFDEILKSPSFSEDIKKRIRAFKSDTALEGREKLNEWVKLSNMIISVFQSNSEVYLTFLPPQ